MGTVKGRLARARDLLRSRLIRRGMGPAAGALASLLAFEAKAALDRPLLERTVRSSFKVAGGQSVSQVVSSSITSLAEGMLTTMILNQFKWTALGILMTGLALTSAGVMARQPAGPKSNPPSTASRDAGKKVDSNPIGDLAFPVKKSERDTIATAKASDPFDAIEMIGASAAPDDARRELIQAERAAYQATWEAFRGGHASAEQLHDLSRRWMEAQDEAPGSTTSTTATTAHLERMRDLLRFESDRPSSPSKAPRSLESRPMFPRHDSGSRRPRREVLRRRLDATGRTEGGRAWISDVSVVEILAKLEEPIPMPFSNEISLDRSSQVHQADNHHPYFLGHPDLRRSPRPARSGTIPQFDGRRSTWKVSLCAVHCSCCWRNSG